MLGRDPVRLASAHEDAFDPRGGTEDGRAWREDGVGHTAGRRQPPAQERLRGPGLPPRISDSVLQNREQTAFCC